MAGERWRLGHRPALDGLRGVAILLVLLGHGLLPRMPMAGAAGVSLFFALSGFLITTLLLERRDRTGAHGLGRFYVRRARRLLPAVGVFLAALAFGSLWWPWLLSPGDLVASAFYVQNFQILHHGTMGDATGHLWSLAIEEQFYLLWPVMLMLAIRRSIGTGLLAAVTVFAASLADRLWLFEHGRDWLHIYFGSGTNAGLLAAGCVAAFVARSGRSLPSGWFWPVIAAVAVVGAEVPYRAVTLTLVPVAVAVAGVFAVLACAGERPPFTPSWLNLIGRRSYALYLWHFPLMVVIPDRLPFSHAVTVPIGLALAWAITCASWRLVEQPVLRARLVRRPVPVPA